MPVMPQVLAVCDDCGTFFPAYEVEVGGPGIEVIEATVDVGSDVDVPNLCPACGGTGHVLGGVYNIVGDTLKLLQGPERTISELERLRVILHEARQSGASAEEVRSTVRHEFPGWGPALARLLVPKTPADFYALIAVVLMVVGMILSAKQAGQATNIEAEQVINNITIVQEASPTPEQRPGLTPSAESTSLVRERVGAGRKVGRNEPCPCDSGLKFKKCCGTDGRTRYPGP